MTRVVFKSVELVNGLLFPRVTLPLENEGLVLLSSENRDYGGDSGCGKTGLLDAIPFILYNRMGRKASAKEYVNELSTDGFVGTVNLEVNGTPVSVRRSIDHSVHGTGWEIFVDGAPRKVIDKRRIAQEIAEVVGVSADQYFGAAYLAQNNSVSLVAARGPAARIAAISNLCGYHVYDDIAKVLKNDHTRLTAAIDPLRDAASRSEAVKSTLIGYPSVEILEQKIDGLSLRVGDLADERERLKTKLTKVETRIREIRRREELEGRVSALGMDPKDVSKALVAKLESKVARMRKEITELDTLETRCKARERLEGELADLPMVGQVDTIEKTLRGVEGELANLSSVVLLDAEKAGDIAKELEDMQAPAESPEDMAKTLTKVERKIGSLRTKIQALAEQKDSGLCPTCKRPWHGLTQEECDSIEGKLTESRSQIRDLNKRRHNLVSAIDSAKEYFDLRKQLRNLRHGGMTLREVRRKIDGELARRDRMRDALEAARRRDRIEAQLVKLPQQDSAEVGDRLEKARRELGTIERNLANMARFRDAYDEMANLKPGNIDKATNARKRFMTRIRDIGDEIDRINSKLGELRSDLRLVSSETAKLEELTEAVKEYKELDKELRLVTAMRKVFAPSGMKASAVRQTMRAVEQVLPKHAARFFPDDGYSFRCEVIDNGVHFIMQQKDNHYSTNRISGGEQAKMNVSVLFAIRDVREKLSGNSQNILIIDEQVNSLCPLGREQFLTLLQDMRETCPTIIVTSHHRDVRGSAVWDKVWHIVRENDQATLIT